MGLHQLNGSTCNQINRKLRRLAKKWDLLCIEYSQMRSEHDGACFYKEQYETEEARAIAEKDGESWVWRRMVARPESDEYISLQQEKLQKLEKRIDEIISQRFALLKRVRQLEEEELRIPAALR